MPLSFYLMKATMPRKIDRDTDLMLSFQKGDETYFIKLVEKHQQSVYGFVYRYMGGREDAEDITQEIFIRVYNAKESYKTKSEIHYLALYDLPQYMH